MITISGIELVPGGANAPSLYDIGYALRLQPRFGGHQTRLDWSVLHHLYAAGYLALEEGASVRVQLLAFMHDAHEAVTGDIPAPWKSTDMRKLQDELDSRIFHSLDVDLPTPFERRLLKTYDTDLLHAESERFGPKKLGEPSKLAVQAVNAAIRVVPQFPIPAGRWFEGVIETILEAMDGNRSIDRERLVSEVPVGSGFDTQI